MSPGGPGPRAGRAFWALLGTPGHGWFPLLPARLVGAKVCSDSAVPLSEVFYSGRTALGRPLLRSCLVPTSSGRPRAIPGSQLVLYLLLSVLRGMCPRVAQKGWDCVASISNMMCPKSVFR